MAFEYQCKVTAVNDGDIKMVESLDGGTTWTTVLESAENTHMGRVAGSLKGVMVAAFDAHVDLAIKEMLKP